LGHVTDLATERQAVARDVMAGDFGAARGRREIAREDAEDGALARAIGAEQAYHFAFADGEGDVADRKTRPVPFHQVLRTNDRQDRNLAAGRPLRPWGRSG